MHPAPARFSILASRHFPAWLAERRLSLALSAYQSGKLVLIGLKDDGQLAVFERDFSRCMGLWADDQRLWLATAFQVWRLDNVLAPGATDAGHDRLFVPRVGHTTGEIDVHDLAPDAHGRPVFVSSLFSCLGTLSETRSFQPLWRPPFVSRIAAEDRCHLNGLAMADGAPCYVSACGQGDAADAWRERRADGGCVIDVRSGEIVAAGLSMPHSPRLHEGRLWLLNSGTGELGWLDPRAGRFEPVAFCPGYARGLALVGRDAVVGLSRARLDGSFAGLPLEAALARRGVEARCGLQVVDLDSGEARHWLRIEGPVEEIYDVAILPRVRRPAALGFKTDEIRRRLWVDDDGGTQRWEGTQGE